jgi:AcrR family transcriptional regulator
VGVRVKDVAERAGLAPSSVLNYNPSHDELLIEVSRGAIDRFAERRAKRALRGERATRRDEKPAE